MNQSLKGVAIEPVTVVGAEVPAFSFSHSRAKQVMAMLFLLTFFPLGAYWWLYPQEATPDMFPLIRAFGPTGTRMAGLAIMGLSVGSLMLMIIALRKRLMCLSLVPSGIYCEGPKRAYFIPWEAIAEVAPFSWGVPHPQSYLGLRIQSPESIQSSLPMAPIMKSNRSLSGWDLFYLLSAFHARPQFVESAFQYYFHNPEQRPAIGTATELGNLASIVAAKWKPPQSPKLTAPIPDPNSNF